MLAWAPANLPVGGTPGWVEAELECQSCCALSCHTAYLTPCPLRSPSCCPAVGLLGSEEQKRELLPDMGNFRWEQGAG